MVNMQGQRGQGFHFLSPLDLSGLALKGKYELTYNLDDLGQEHAISHILLEVLDEAFVARFGEVMIGPIGVDLQKKAHRQHQESGQSPLQGLRQLLGPMLGCHSHCPAGTVELENFRVARAINIQCIVLARHSASWDSPRLLRKLCQGPGKS